MLSILLSKIQWYESVGFKWLVVVAVVAACYGLGLAIGRALRLNEYGWKIGVVLASLGVAPVIIWARWPPNLGVDLNGGMILIYQIDEKATLTSGSPDDPNAAPQVTSSRKRRGTTNVAGGGVNVTSLISQLTRRINPSGTLEIKVRQYGERQIEIIIPETDPEEVARIKRLIEKAGVLEFLIMADTVRDQDLIDLASTPAEREQTFVVRNRGKENEAVAGRWVKVGREQELVKGVRPLKVPVVGRKTRDARTKAPLTVPAAIANQNDEKGDKFAQWLEDKGIDEVEVLMVQPTANERITGNELSGVQSSYDEQSAPCVNFNMTAIGGSRMARLTSANSPDQTSQHYRNLGIVLDDELLSAPRIQSVISDHGRITGKFTSKEVAELVGILRGGSLSAVLIKEPVSENPIGPELGADTIRKGTWSSGISLLCVLIFMMLYYRFSGIVAVWTLMINLLVMFAIMVLFHATFTLSGIAGIVLTMGMAVDANVLIFERIREELARGAALRMALRNGFSRASTTIIDSNLTTLITAVVLYVIGTDQIRGFAVTLILGIVLSMYASIFCARLVFDIGERKRWLTRLTMIKLMTETKLNFMGLWQGTTIASLVLIGAGIAATFFRGQEILGIDFTGGTSVHLMLKDPMPVDEVRAKLETAFNKANQDKGKTLQFNLVNVPVEGQKPETIYKVDSTLADEKREDGTTLNGVEELKRYVSAEFVDPKTGLTLLAQNVLSFDPATIKTEVTAATPTDDPTSGLPPFGTPEQPGAIKPGGNDFEEPKEPAEKTPAGKTPDEPATEKKAEKADPEAKDPEKKEPEKNEGALIGPRPVDELAFAPDVANLVAQAEQEEKPAAEKPAADDPPAVKSKEDGKSDEDKKSDEGEKPATDEPEDEAPPVKQPPVTGGNAAPPGLETPAERKVSSEIVLKFSEAIGRDVLRDEIKRAAERAGITLLDNNIVLRTANLDEGSAEVVGVTKRREWGVRMPTDEAQTRQVLSSLQKDMADKIHWPSWNKIGTSIADKMKRVAVFALLASCLGIIAYIWFRFEKISYGLAAIVAVIHDILIMLAAIALSHWLYRAFGFAGIEDFKINMIEVAAFLTIIGYSLNDTIVIFDRIREVKGKSPNINQDMINLSVNQTLSRTMLTSITTLIVVVILYFFGGQAVHGFAFALLVGILSGTYSTVFIAAPLLLWMSRYGKAAKTPTKVAA